MLLLTELNQKPKVWNKRDKNVPINAVYIGRPSKWGNPFEIGRDGNRDEVIAKYRIMILANPFKLADVKRELKGKDLVCWCSPSSCHGDVLIKIANS
jgi:hypothetical protein